MPNPLDSLPQDVVAAWRAGNKIDAIKRLRETHPMGLAEAKAMIDALDGRGAAKAPPPLQSTHVALQAKGPLPQEIAQDIAQTWRRGDKLGALRRVADLMNAAGATASASPTPAKGVQVVHPHKHLAPPVLPSEMLAPGEVPRSKSGPGLLLALAIALAALAWIYESTA